MKLIFCIDDKNGLMFNGRRQSQDRVLRERILNLATNSRLWMSDYSSRQFTEGGNITIDNDYANKAEKDDYCFIEDGGYNFENCTEIVLYNWNRHYPSDIQFDFDLKANGYKRVSKTDFAGSSHKKITEEIYVRKDG
ncbi:MAG: ribonuclease Z [Clostridia bacterium]|nr:ribonuclease Z [Clostridia bacterium]